MVVVSAIFVLKEKIDIQKMLAIITAFLAVVIVATEGNLSAIKFTDFYGVLFAVVGASSYGLFSALVKKFNYEQITSNLLFFFYAFLLSLVSILMFDKVLIPNLVQFAGLFWIGSFVYGIATVLWLKALAAGSTAKVSNLIFLTPFLSLVYIAIFLGEKIKIPSLIGLALLVVSIVYQNRQH
jgi:drug/metabolite transporter (DMT)-like permease